MTTQTCVCAFGCSEPAMPKRITCAHCNHHADAAVRAAVAAAEAGKAEANTSLSVDRAVVGMQAFIVGLHRVQKARGMDMGAFEDVIREALNEANGLLAQPNESGPSDGAGATALPLTHREASYGQLVALDHPARVTTYGATGVDEGSL